MNKGIQEIGSYTVGTGMVGAILTIIDSATDDSTYTVIALQSPTGR